MDMLYSPCNLSFFAVTVVSHCYAIFVISTLYGNNNNNNNNDNDNNNNITNENNNNNDCPSGPKKTSPCKQITRR